MASRTEAGSRYGRRILWLAFAIMVVIAAYSAVWFYLARSLEQRTAAAITSINGPGVRASCEEPLAGGFPFRIGVSCHSVFYENAGSGVSIRAGRFRSAANVYQPFRVVGEVDGPASIVFPYAALQARWESLRASARLARPMPERASVEGTNIVVSFDEEAEDTALASVKDVQVHARQLGPDVETAANFRGLSLGEVVAPELPVLEGRLLAMLKDGVALSQSGAFDLRGREATIQELVVGVVGSEAGLTVSGPISIGDDGLISADLSVRVDDFPAVARFLAQALPELRDHLMAASAAFGNLGETPLQLRIVRGRAFIGFIPLGVIPAI